MPVTDPERAKLDSWNGVLWKGTVVGRAPGYISAWRFKTRTRRKGQIKLQTKRDILLLTWR